jgi:ABC-2 type transport system ATP-binding protein
MSEMALTADHVLVVGRGRLLRDQTMPDFIADASSDLRRVTPTPIGSRAVTVTT